jgi:hypothetical protein
MYHFFMELILNGFEAHCHFRAQKTLDFQGPPLLMPLVMDLARLKRFRTAPYKQQVQAKLGGGDLVGHQRLAIVR